MVKSWRFVTLLLVSLSMALAVGNLLQLPARLGMEGPEWLQRQGLLAGAGLSPGVAVELAAFACAVVLAWLVRGRYPAFQWTLAAAALLGIAQIMWWLFILPLRGEIATWAAGLMPPYWEELRAQWEYADAARAVLQIAGFSAALLSVIAETPPVAVRRLTGHGSDAPSASPPRHGAPY